ncbi:hypothetical protein PIB30_092436 [Stylosanthes scabra]|uniref:Uncharacterized protein n=1 Tax=Stylosanthes scabra TaxID=79078 RepID=A0ABU6SX76_9FABA|nr:hypothetical protein [Stylosanthes scabra]
MYSGKKVQQQTIGHTYSSNLKLHDLLCHRFDKRSYFVAKNSVRHVEIVQNHDHVLLLLLLRLQILYPGLGGYREDFLNRRPSLKETGTLEDLVSGRVSRLRLLRMFGGQGHASSRDDRRRLCQSLLLPPVVVSAQPNSSGTSPDLKVFVEPVRRRAMVLDV